VSEVFHTSPYLLAEKNGEEVGQSVPHLHFHYIPRKKGADSILYFLWRGAIAQIQKPLSPVKMKEIVHLLKAATPLLPEEKSL
jgi:diadenosine tetraphosphate (Ap4A) HIT family hydrolase